MRTAKNLSQEQVAHNAGMSLAPYSRYEQSEVRPDEPVNPTLRTLTSLAVALDVEVVELLPAAPR